MSKREDIIVQATPISMDAYALDKYCYGSMSCVILHLQDAHGTQASVFAPSDVLAGCYCCPPLPSLSPMISYERKKSSRGIKKVTLAVPLQVQ